MKTSRRNFIKSAGSLTIFFSLDQQGILAAVAGPDDPELPGVLKRLPAVSAWLEVLANGSVRVFTGKVELGQGLCGAIAQVTGEELDLGVNQVEVVIADTRRTPDEGFTGGSFSTENSVLSVRYAAAAARQELLALAVPVLAAPADQLSMRDGKIYGKAGGRSVSFFELLEGKKLQSEVRLPLRLKQKEEYRLSGKAVPREDFKRMITGSEMYIQDFRLPGMVHARTVSPPSYNSKLLSVDEAALQKALPVLKVIVDGSFLAVVCADEYDALKARELLGTLSRWSTPTAPPPAAAMPEFLKSLTVASAKIKEAKIPFPESPAVIKAAYYKPYIMHGAIAPSCAVARYESGLLEIWTHSQGAYPLRDTIGRLLNISNEKIQVTCLRGSGCYGHNGADDAAAEAAMIAVAFPGKPVRLQWSRAQEHQWEPYGTAMCMELEAVLEKDGLIAHFRNSVWSDTHYIRGNQGYMNIAGYRAAPAERQKNPSGSGAYRNADLYYAVANQTVTAHFFNGPLRCSNLRSLGSYANLFAVESFMDELAAIAKIDPFEFRTRQLKDPKALKVLERLKKTVQNLPEEKHTETGIAFSRYKNAAAYIAVAARLRVDPLSGKITLKKLWAVIDAGEVISLDSVINQVEGGMIQAASWTLFEAVKFKGQEVQSRNWTDYPLIRFNDIPEVEVQVISDPHEKLQGVGEIAMCVVPAAITNAIFRACGRRIRNLPIGRQLDKKLSPGQT